ncbi:hypothetical protein MKX08_002315 [Trichoderma sp. CBMAI-0020]|nr:hypothetical protein MKX08_002315 [Trichoderma sp. CBMAI-0020]
MPHFPKAGLSSSRAQSRLLQASSWRRYSFGSQRTFATSGMRLSINKICGSAAEAIVDMKSNSTVLVGGFGLCGVPNTLINEVRANKSRINGLTAVSNNAGTNGSGLSLLLETRQIRKMVASYIGDNKIFGSQYGNGKLEVELTPQGTIAEKCRAGGAGIPAFYTPAAMGTVVQTGELPTKHHPDGTPAEFSLPKNVRIFNGKPYLLEEAFNGDYAFIKAFKADRLGNCQFHLSAANFNGPMARNAKMTIVEAEHIVEVGELKPNEIHLPGIYVKRVIQSQVPKAIEKYVNSKELDVSTNSSSPASSSLGNSNREMIALRAAKGFKNGMYVNLGIGILVLASTFVPPEVEVLLHSENGILGLGPYPKKGEENPELINASKDTTTIIPGACTFSNDESFGMIRSGRIDLTILGAMQVNATGDLANWMLPRKVKGFGGALDLVSNPEKTKVVVTMEHTDRKGNPKIVRQCTFPLTGRKCVSTIITELGVFDVDWKEGLTLQEIASGVTIDEVESKTEARFKVAEDLKIIDS